MVCSVECAINLQSGIMSKKATWTHSRWLEELQKDVNKAVRLIDHGHPCISNGSAFKEGIMDAGHYYARSTHPVLRFHLLNIWGQSKYDNRFMEGNRQGFSKGLSLVGGSELLEEIERSHKSLKRVNGVFLSCLPLVTWLGRSFLTLRKKVITLRMRTE